MHCIMFHRNKNIPDGTCLFTGINYGSRAVSMGRNWDCVKRGIYNYHALCPCYGCWGDYTYRHIKLQSICRMFLVRKDYLRRKYH